MQVIEEWLIVGQLHLRRRAVWIIMMSHGFTGWNLSEKSEQINKNEEPRHDARIKMILLFSERIDANGRPKGQHLARIRLKPPFRLACG